MMYAELKEFWERNSQQGWSSCHFQSGLFYPMPGTDAFNDDTEFLALPLFPSEPSSEVVRVSDDVWSMPPTWFRQSETRPQHELRITFKLESPTAASGLVSAALLAVKRCMYLEMFRSRRPVALSTLRKRCTLYLAFARHACFSGKNLKELHYSDIAVVLSSLSPHDLRGLPAIYDLLRWWKATGSQSYTFFTVPPSISAIRIKSGSHRGVDSARIRGDLDQKIGRQFQALPDEFVSAAGEFCLSVLDELRPAVMACMRKVMAVEEGKREDAVNSIVGDHDWPLSLKIVTARDLKSAATLCQTATIFILSLVIGPRWSEVAALRTDAVQRRTLDGKITHLLKGPTFKLSQSTTGDSRDWPINPRVAGYLEAQSDYVELVEEEGFPFLWRSQERLWGGRRPLRQFDKMLKAFARSHGFARLLGKDPIHHHRFRKTTARLIVIALHGGPHILRRLFGHEHLVMTLRYILANNSIVDELRAIAEEEHRRAASLFVANRSRLRGGGATQFTEAISHAAKLLEVTVPGGKRDQKKVKTQEILEVICDSPDGLVLKQIVPGLIACFKPNDEAGMCCRAGQLPNVARCDSRCKWHLVVPEFVDQARMNVEDALEHLAGAKKGSLIWVHYARVVRQKVKDFPELASAYTDNSCYQAVTESGDGDPS